MNTSIKTKQDRRRYARLARAEKMIAKAMASNQTSCALEYIHCKGCNKSEPVRPNRTYYKPGFCFKCGKNRKRSKQTREEKFAKMYPHICPATNRKKCKDCNEWKSRDEYHSHGSGDRVSSRCAPCRSAFMLLKSKSKPERIKRDKERIRRSRRSRIAELSKKIYGAMPVDIYYHTCLHCGGIECRPVSDSMPSPYCSGCFERRYSDRRMDAHDPIVNCSDCDTNIFVPYGFMRMKCDECKRKTCLASKRKQRARRDARIRGSGVGMNVDPYKIFKRDKWRCKMCLTKVQKSDHLADNAAELDHIVPLSKSGKHIPSNLQCLCRKCNGNKSDRLIGQASLFSAPG